MSIPLVNYSNSSTLDSSLLENEQIPNKEGESFQSQKVASLILDQSSNESFFEKAKIFVSEIQDELKKLQKERVSLKDPLWIFKALGRAYSSYGQPVIDDPMIDVKKAILQAIQESKIESLFDILKNPDSRAIVNEPLPNGHLILNDAVLIGNKKIIKLLLRAGCDPEKRDFQFQSAFDLVDSLKNEHIKEVLTKFIVNLQFNFYLRDFQNLETVDKNEVMKNLIRIDTIIRQKIDEKTVVDPLAISADELVAFSMGIVILLVRVTNWSVMPLGRLSFDIQNIVKIALVLGNIHEMRSLFQNSGKFQYPLIACNMLSQLIPSVNLVFSSFKVGIVGLSMLNSLKVSFDNYAIRPFDTTKKIIVDSFNFYNFISNTFAIKIPMAFTEKLPANCKDLKKILAYLHPDQPHGNEELMQIFTTTYEALCSKD